MKQNVGVWRAGMVLSMMVLSGCVKYYDLVESEFPQAKKEADQQTVAAAYKRSSTVYDQFETKAVFDALWLADDVRTAYVQMHANKRGLSAEAKEELLKRQLEENKHWLSFYVLADVRDRAAGMLGDSATAWTMFAECDGAKLPVESVKEHDLEPEFQLLFGTAHNAFKTCYLVKCPLPPTCVQALSTGAAKHVGLTIGSPKYQAPLVWKIDQLHQHKAGTHEDFYWG